MAYKVKFRIIGDRPPFTVTLHEDNITKPAVLTKTVTTSDIIDYLEDNQSYTISPSINYCIKAVDDINNIVNQCEIPYPDIPPIASNVTCSGPATIGSVLVGAYDYYDENGDDERGSTYKWYRSDDNKDTNRKQIIDANSQVYRLVESDVGKYIQFSVTPKNLNATGDEFFSNYKEIIKDEPYPIIEDYIEVGNILTWRMSDGSDVSSQTVTWIVQYSLNGGSTWSGDSYGGGSPRKSPLFNKIYGQEIYFRVKRYSEPKTEWSQPFKKMVGQVHNFKNITVNLFGDNTTNPSQAFCGSGNQYTNTIPIYLENENTEIKTGTQLYYKANATDGFIRPATQNNINTYKAYGSQDIPMGISHVRFYLGNDSPYWTTWNVDPVSGQLTTQNNMCNR